MFGFVAVLGIVVFLWLTVAVIARAMLGPQCHKLASHDLGSVDIKAVAYWLGCKAVGLKANRPPL